MADMEKPIVKKGRRVSPAELSQMDELRTLLKPEAGMKRVEDFAKWLFASTATIATLGAAFSTVALGALVGTGKLLFALSVISVGLSLACATMSLVPRWVEVNLNSRDSMLTAVIKQFRYRRRFLRTAAVFFALALILASLSPFVSGLAARPKLEPARVSVDYNLEAGGKFETNVSAFGLMSYTTVEVELRTEPPVKGMILPRRRALTDEKGMASLKLEVPVVLINKIKGNLLVNIRWPESTGMMREETLKIPIIQAS